MNMVFVAICVLILFTVGAASQTQKRLSEDEVVRKAEEFIIQQGYTDLPATQDKSKLKAAFDEGIDDSSIKLRRNTLLKKAYGLSRQKCAGEWLVVFLHNPENELYRVHAIDVSKIGRGVTMDAYGGNIRMRHQNVRLEFKGLKKLDR